jgi:photosystem I P700 chlorophyll a apoprotein A1
LGNNSIELKPVFASFIQALLVHFNKIIRITQELGTADFMVHHIHTFTIHISVLILLKSVLYARSSRLVSDKRSLGFRYPCDGPGRGGTCQISAWDHTFLSSF